MSDKRGQGATAQRPPDPPNLAARVLEWRTWRLAAVLAICVLLAIAVWRTIDDREPEPPPVTSSSPAASTTAPAPATATPATVTATPATTAVTSGPTQAPTTAETSQAPARPPLNPKSPGVPHQSSTRSPSWQPNRTAPREGIAPTLPMREAAEFFADTDVRGLITVLAARWVPATGAREPLAGYEFLAVQVQIEALDGPVRYGPTNAFVTDADGGGYTFIYNSALETDYPQFEIEELPAGQMITGWIVFELPRADVTFVYQSYEEQAIRVKVPGGPVANPVEPDLPLDVEFKQTLYSGEGTVGVEGASWFSEALHAQPGLGNEFLAVKVRITAGHGGYGISDSQFAITLPDGEVVAPIPLESETFRPAFTGADLVEDDQLAGWIIFELPRQEVTLTLRGFGDEELGSVQIPD